MVQTAVGEPGRLHSLVNMQQWKLASSEVFVPAHPPLSLAMHLSCCLLQCVCHVCWRRGHTEAVAGGSGWA